MDSYNMLLCISCDQIEEEAPPPPPPPPPPPKALGCSAELLISLENDQRRLSADIIKMEAQAEEITASFIGGIILHFLDRTERLDPMFNDFNVKRLNIIQGARESLEVENNRAPNNPEDPNLVHPMVSNQSVTDRLTKNLK
ncbi:hypothetical protein KY290_022875 [Solanum tuberosum]|uniref:Integrase core domain containing protein n=1 Tax=Solanum tuberosum TaxID=4113 RepID=A0ABQ7V7P9_SOLTU|nr:hypothetical protein KY284_021777 [Solanum tuberosum]KAH0759382.1 hypothetical protein KY290_022875 [Solanum tuberosum]